MLNFKRSNLGIYQIIEMSPNKRYILDTSKTTPKTYGWGMLPRQVEVEMTELEPSNQMFNLENKAHKPIMWIVIAVQPFVKISYDALKELFKGYNISQQYAVKALLFGLSIVIAYGLYRFYLRDCHQQSEERLPLNSRKFRLVFKTSNKRNVDYYLLVIANLVLFWAFFVLNNGTEGAVLVLNCLITTLWFIICLGMYPVGVFYTKGHFILESVEEK